MSDRFAGDFVERQQPHAICWHRWRADAVRHANSISQFMLVQVARQWVNQWSAASGMTRDALRMFRRSQRHFASIEIQLSEFNESMRVLHCNTVL